MLKMRDFKDKGYSVYKPNPLEGKWAWKLIQKRISDSTENTKYFINVYLSDYRLWGIYDRINYPKGLAPRSFTIKIQFYRNDITFDITINNKWNSIEDIELMCEEIWQNLDMDYDHHN